MNNQQRALVHLALRELGRNKFNDWESVGDVIHGLRLAAIPFNASSIDLDQCYKCAGQLMLEEVRRS